MLVNQALSLTDEIDALGPKRKRRARLACASEDQVQRSIIDRGRMIGVLCIHVPNAAARSRAGHGRMRGLGLLAGCPDLYCLSQLRPGAHCWLEVKPEGWSAPGGVSKARQHYERQRDAHQLLTRFGAFASFVRSQDEAVAAWREAGLL